MAFANIHSMYSSLTPTHLTTLNDIRDLHNRPKYIYANNDSTQIIAKLARARLIVPIEKLIQLKFENNLDAYIQRTFSEELLRQIGPLKYTIRKERDFHNFHNPFTDLTTIETALYIEEHQ